MNTGVVTTGVFPLAVGSVETFQLQVDVDGIPHSLAGGSATLAIKDPNGNVTTYTATITANDAFVPWTTPNLPGNYTRAWTWTDAAGVGPQVSLPIPFSVVSSP